MTDFLNNRRAFCFSASGVTSTSSSVQTADTTTSDPETAKMDAFEQQMEDESDANTIKQGKLEEKQDEMHQMQAAALKAFKEEDIS